MLLVIHQNISLLTLDEMYQRYTGGKNSIDRSKEMQFTILHWRFILLLYLFPWSWCVPPSVIRFGFPLTFLQIKAPRTHFPATLPQKDCLSSLFSSGRLSSYIVLSDLDIWIEGFLLKIIKILQLFQQLNSTQPFQILEEDSLKGAKGWPPGAKRFSFD